MALDVVEKKLIASLPSEAISFFAVFCRFEYALKRAGYLKRDSVEGKMEIAEASWPKFASDFEKVFFKEIESSGKATTLLGEPPRRQVVVDHILQWEPVAPAKRVQDLFGSVCRVRNNLFHGGKFALGPEYGSERDQALLREARWVLEQALHRQPKVQAYFEEVVS